MNKHYEIPGGDLITTGEASSDIKKTLQKLGVPMKVIKRTAVSMYEAEINMVIHGGGGVCDVGLTPEAIKIIFKDQGPGIPDIDQAMMEGFSTASDHVREMGFGAGMGLPNIRKNSDELTIESEVDRGTTVKILIRMNPEE